MEGGAERGADKTDEKCREEIWSISKTRTDPLLLFECELLSIVHVWEGVWKVQTYPQKCVPLCMQMWCACARVCVCVGELVVSCLVKEINKHQSQPSLFRLFEVRQEGVGDLSATSTKTPFKQGRACFYINMSKNA